MAEPAEGAKTDARRITSFPPVGDGRTRLLILGSLPGVISLRRGQYYGNPRNQFWRLAAEILGAEMPAAYEQRLATLIAAGVGLWDVVGSATRTGSLDADIRGPPAKPARRLRRDASEPEGGRLQRRRRLEHRPPTACRRPSPGADQAPIQQPGLHPAFRNQGLGMAGPARRHRLTGLRKSSEIKLMNRRARRRHRC